MSITVVGLGIGEGISKEAEKAISEAKNVVVKTAKSKNYAYFNNIEHVTLDSLFDSVEDFDELNQKGAEYLLGLKGKTVLCIDGDGTCDGIVSALLQSTKDVKFIYGASNVSSMKSVAKGALSYTLYTATDLMEIQPVEFDRGIPVFITELDNKYLASEVNLYLLDKIGETNVFFYGKKWLEIPLVELDRQKLDHNSACIVMPQNLKERERFGFSDLVKIMRKLRAPDGCPWDRAQTHESIRKNLIEEAYELDDAIAKGDDEMMTEECGDVLLQAVFNAQIGEDMQEFSVTDMLSMLCLKLVHRHTHIFGDVKATNASEALKAWEAAKKVEKAGKGKFDTVPESLPALLRAAKVLKSAGEEKKEVKNPKGAKKWGEELFEMVREMRNEGVDGEQVLQDAIREYIKSEEEKN